MEQFNGKTVKCNILGTEIDDVTLDAALEKILSGLDSGFGYIVTPNPEMIYRARKDAALDGALRNAALALPDGIGVIYASKILGRPIAERVGGIDLATALLPRMAEKGRTLYLAGAKPGIAELAAENLLKENPNLIISGTVHGYLKDDELAEHLKYCGADVIFVCLGVPRQEIFMRKYADYIGAKLLIGLGGSLDVFAGTVKRAPERWRRMNLEWLYRISHDPRRLRRSLTLPKFLFTVIGARLFKK